MRIIEEYMLNYITGIEYQHFINNTSATAHYIESANKHGLIMTGGSDYHQKPILIGTLDISDYVAEQFRR